MQKIRPLPEALFFPTAHKIAIKKRRKMIHNGSPSGGFILYAKGYRM